MRIENEAITNVQSEETYLSHISSIAFDRGMSLALWQLPTQNTRHLILSEKHELINKETTLEELPAGFIFAPFERERERIYLKGDFHFVFNNDGLLPPDSPKKEASLSWLSSNLSLTKQQDLKVPKSLPPSDTKTKDDFIRMVEDAITAIDENDFEKVVPSRIKKIPIADNFDILTAFKKLCKAYPNTMVSLVHIPGIGTWLGASPEILVSVENGSIFKTVALAGTKELNHDINLKSVAWTQKEIEEQALVERYIISCFKKIRLREYDEYGPKTTVAGNLLHLKSDFTVDMKATNFPQLGSVMLSLLHPTSAVCGMPLEPARAFLKHHEGYDREFYAGYLGPVNIHNDTHIFVNLRCMQLVNGFALFYAGAGVTADSIPENEWEETEIKLNTLSAIIL
jgi:isochorismate synthase